MRRRRLRKWAKWTCVLTAGVCVTLAVFRRWVFAGGSLLVGSGAAMGFVCGWPILIGAVLAAFWALWPEEGRETDDRHCSVCGYPFPEGVGVVERRCPECGSVD